MAAESAEGPRIPISSKKKIAFVCSGGAAKAGAFHLGVALALQEAGFKFYGGTAQPEAPGRAPRPMEISTYVGSSAGSIISTLLAAGYSLDNIFNSFLGRDPDPNHPEDLLPKVLPRLTYKKMFKIRPKVGAKAELLKLNRVRKLLTDLVKGDWQALIQLRWLKIAGIFSTEGIEEYLREEVLLSNQFKDYLPDLFIVATQLNHSRKVVFGKYAYQPPPHDLTCQYDNTAEISHACAASTSLPVIFAPYAIPDGRGKQTYYIDGEIRETLSTHVAVDSGADLIIASYTHQPYHFVREIGSLTEHGLPSIVIQSIYLLIEQKINNHIHNKQVQRNAILAVSRYCKDAGVSDTHRSKILELLERELHHRVNVDSIYIHPSPSDAKLFFGDHFSLSPRKMGDIVRSGFRAGSETLRRYAFADFVEPSPVVRAL